MDQSYQVDNLALVLMTVWLRVVYCQAKSPPVVVSVFSMSLYQPTQSRVALAVLGKITQVSTVALVPATVNLVGWTSQRELGGQGWGEEWKDLE